MNENIEIGIRIKEFALSKCGSLTEFCEKMEIKLQAIYPYINGKSLPGAQFLLKMQKMGCSIDWLLSGERSAAEKLVENMKKLIEEV